MACEYYLDCVDFTDIEQPEQGVVIEIWPDSSTKPNVTDLAQESSPLWGIVLVELTSETEVSPISILLKDCVDQSWFHGCYVVVPSNNELCLQFFVPSYQNHELLMQVCTPWLSESENYSDFRLAVYPYVEYVEYQEQQQHLQNTAPHQELDTEVGSLTPLHDCTKQLYEEFFNAYSQRQEEDLLNYLTEQPFLCCYPLQSGRPLIHLIVDRNEELPVIDIIAQCPDYINFCDAEQNTALHLAVVACNFDAVQVLVTVEQCNINSLNVINQTPLDICERHNYHLISYLLEMKGGQRYTEKEYVSKSTIKQLLPNHHSYQPTLPPSFFLPSPTDVTVQIASDLHLEFYTLHSLPKSLIDQQCNILLLLGDIGYPKSQVFQKFMNQQCSRFMLVIFIPGNHEYYNKISRRDMASYHREPKTTMLEVREQLVAYTERWSNFIFLDNHSISLGPNIRIIGSTLWQHIDLKEQLRKQQLLNDYQLIYKTQSSMLTVHDTNALFLESAKFIQEEVENARAEGQTAIVCTHFPPLPECWDHPKDKIDLSDLCRAPLKYWFYGHTHKSLHLQKHDTEIISNQRGYTLRRSRQGVYDARFTTRILAEPYVPSAFTDQLEDGSYANEYGQCVLNAEQPPQILTTDECNLTDDHVMDEELDFEYLLVEEETSKPNVNNITTTDVENVNTFQNYELEDIDDFEDLL